MKCLNCLRVSCFTNTLAHLFNWLFKWLPRKRILTPTSYSQMELYTLFTVTGSLPASFNFRTTHSKKVSVFVSPLGYWILNTKYTHSRSPSAIEMSSLSSAITWPSIEREMWSYCMGWPSLQPLSTIFGVVMPEVLVWAWPWGKGNSINIHLKGKFNYVHTTTEFGDAQYYNFGRYLINDELHGQINR